MASRQKDSVISLVGPLLSIIGIMIILALASTGCDDGSGTRGGSGSGSGMRSSSGAAVYSGQGQQQSCGGYGEVCCQGNYCDYGECQGGMCVHCGYMGETCCYNSVDSTQCEWGSFCSDGVCKASSDYTTDCGHIGYEPCYYNGAYTCYYGILDTRRNVCLACGDYEQPCCTYTDYPCSYGRCTVGYPHTGGICKKPASNPTPTPTPQAYSTPARYTYGSTPTPQPTEESCGHEGEDCCVDFRRMDPTRAWEADPPCYDGLECWNGVCTDMGDGPTMIAYDRASDTQY
jgi:hypothetical protein